MKSQDVMQISGDLLLMIEAESSRQDKLGVINHFMVAYAQVLSEMQIEKLHALMAKADT